MPIKTKQAKRNLLSIKIYFNPKDKMQMEVYNDLKQLQNQLGTSLSTTAGMAMRSGVPHLKHSTKVYLSNQALSKKTT